MKKLMKDRKGFTLVELIVVIAILGILAAVLIPQFTGFQERSRQKAAISDARNVLVSVQALLAEGDTSITMTDIETISGTDFTGTIGDATTLSNDTFDYTVSINSIQYVVKVTNGSIDTEFVKAGTGAVGSTSAGL